MLTRCSHLGAKILAAIIMFQTLFFKFTASEESVYIFTKIGMEPWGRIGSGVIELIASILILIPMTAWIGALLGIGAMLGALFFHITTLGITVLDDGGYLFFLCLTVLLCCLYVFWVSLFSLPDVVKHFLPKFLVDYINRKGNKERD